jgi:indolepyruvate ferredoxin oxidoreductase
MGGEGAPWIGMAPFSERRHMFQNIGDGTFFHSGALAIQACVAAKVNITFKLLYNGHVAMTGGQDAQGALPVPELTRKLEAEGVKRIVVMVEDVDRYREIRDRFASAAELRPREDLTEVLRELERVPGVSVLIYDQECAAEKRRQRSRGKVAAPAKRLLIQEDVCEGCGDCVTQSNCASLQRVATAKGEKMRIHQSSCNRDYTCAMGDCPSFLTVIDDAPKPQVRAALPTPPAVAEPSQTVSIGGFGYRILMPGVGGTGVVTINAILATAALRDGLFVTTLDQTGLAQKGGAVTSHLTLSRTPLAAAARIAAPDVVVAFDADGAPPDFALAVKNTPLPGTLHVDAARLAEELLGSHLFVNMFLLGFAWQAGLIPITRASIEEAIRLNGVAVDGNLAAFAWGRAHFGKPSTVHAPEVVEALDYAVELAAYQDSRYAREHQAFVARMPAEIRETVAMQLYRLMAYKDEYEVARLLSSVEQRVSYNLHPPFLRALGRKRKIELGPWFRPALKLLASLKFLRGTPFDLFGYARHRREERAAVEWYRSLLLAHSRHPAARELAKLPESIRGYDEIKSRSIAQARKRAEELLAAPALAVLR